MMLAMVLVVFLRYGLNIGSVALQETVMYLHAIIFLLGMGYTLKEDAHVRVDVFYRSFTNKVRRRINLLGTLLFLLPFTAVIVVFGVNV